MYLELAFRAVTVENVEPSASELVWLVLAVRSWLVRECRSPKVSGHIMTRFRGHHGRGPLAGLLYEVWWEKMEYRWWFWWWWYGDSDGDSYMVIIWWLYGDYMVILIWWFWWWLYGDYYMVILMVILMVMIWWLYGDSDGDYAIMILNMKHYSPHCMAISI